jgi:class 3 adenylate cyclase
VPELRDPVRSLTLLFTDLRGSTALYDSLGDERAFALVRSLYIDHAEAVYASGGVVVKTMGDAIMASFSRPLDSIRAAVAMLENIDAFNASRAAEAELGLKVGVHEGPALVVSVDDRLDYFGQTVNIAARVQGLAGPGEVCHTDAVLSAAGVEELLRSHGFAPSVHFESLKGVGEPVRVHRWRRG